MIYLQTKFYFGLCNFYMQNEVGKLNKCLSYEVKWESCQVLQLLEVNTKAHYSKWELCNLFLSLRENLIVLTLFLDFAKIWGALLASPHFLKSEVTYEFLLCD